MNAFGLLIVGFLISLPTFASEVTNGYEAILEAYRSNPELQKITPLHKMELNTQEGMEIWARLAEAGATVPTALGCGGFICGRDHGPCLSPCSCVGESEGVPGNCSK